MRSDYICTFEIAEGFENNPDAKKEMEACVNNQLGSAYAKDHKTLLTKRFRYHINGEERLLPVRLNGFHPGYIFLGTVYTYGLNI